MPIYEYQCDNGHRFEVIQSFSDDDLTECRECGAPVRRLMSAPAIHFKGKGFHNTDYGKGSRRRTGDGEAASSGTGESGDSKGDSTSDSGSSSDSGSGSSSDSGSDSGSSPNGTPAKTPAKD